MRIHHFTIPAHDTKRVANLLAELLGARVVPMPHPQGSLLVYAGDSDGSAIEVWPAATRGVIGGDDLELSNLPLPEAWPHHGYVTTDASDADGAGSSDCTTPFRSINLRKPQKCIGQRKAESRWLGHERPSAADAGRARSQLPSSSAPSTFGHTAASTSGGRPS